MRSKPSWQVCRTALTQRDGRRRWDEVYQLLLHWVMAEEANSLSVRSQLMEEAPHGSCPVCPRLYQPATTATDD
jgi:hypothetical protein